VGGEFLLFKTNALVGALSLLLFFALACRLVRPWFAAGGTLALAICLPEVYFARDTFSEVTTQALFIAGMCAAWDARERSSWRWALAAGACFGLASAARIDAFVWLIPIAVYAVGELWVIRGLSGPRRGDRLRVLLALLLGLAPGVALGVADLLAIGDGYFRGHSSEITSSWLAAGGVALVGGALLAVRPRLLGVTTWVSRRRAAIAATLAGAIVVIGLYGLILRPHVEVGRRDWDPLLQAFIESYQQMNGLPLDGHRTYSEDTFRWLSWYLGPLVVLAAILGLALMARLAVLGRERRTILLLLILGAIAVLYLREPNASPIQLWITRRMLPVIIPGLVLGAAWLAQELWTRRTVGRVPLRPLVAAGCAVALVFPAVRTAALADKQTYVPLVYEMEQACAKLPPRATVLFLQAGAPSMAMPMTVRTFCQVPVAVAGESRTAPYALEVAKTAKAHGRTLVVASAAPLQLAEARPLGTMSLQYSRLEQTIERPPTELSPLRRDLVLSEIR
jgi:Dolichyl-phosphate-mannose-protein mannosyltransferase